VEINRWLEGLVSADVRLFTVDEPRADDRPVSQGWIETFRRNQVTKLVHTISPSSEEVTSSGWEKSLRDQSVESEASSAWRHPLVVASLVITSIGYAWALLAFPPADNPAVVLLSAIPIVIAGAFFGLRFVAGFLVVVSLGTIGAIEFLGPGFGQVFQTYRGIPLLMLIVVGLVVGRLRDLRVEMDLQLQHSRRIESELRATQHQLEDSLVAKDELIASVGHQLRTPLTAVLGFAELLKVGSQSEMAANDRQEMVSHIAREAFGLSATIDDLLVASRMEIGRLEVTSVPISLRAQVAQVVENWEREQVANLNISGEDVRAIGDPARVRQVLRNLIANALEYGGSRVDVRVGSDSGQAFVEVSDDGPGLPDDQWEAIFEPYHRYHTEASQPGSVGLGLTVSRGLAQIMGGTLQFNRDDGESTFQLRLPRATNS
jgi:signal transduction histidine kinase